MSDRPVEHAKPAFSSSDISALAHLYRGEVYRSTVWRTRLDATTNWAVLTTGIALSLTFSSESASPLPLVVVGLLVATFLGIEARRYRFFDFWRMRAHILEVYFFGPILRGDGIRTENGWNEVLYEDYRAPSLHITYAEAIGRRLRHNYCWIFAIQVTAYIGKLLIHPSPVASLQEVWARAAIGPIPGQIVVLAGVRFIRRGSSPRSRPIAAGAARAVPGRRVHRPIGCSTSRAAEHPLQPSHNRPNRSGRCRTTFMPTVGTTIMRTRSKAGLPGIVLVLALASPATLSAGPIDPETPACKLIPLAALTPLLGDPVVIRQTNKTAEGVSNCFWRGATKGADIGLHFITFASQKVQGGTALQYFRQSERNERERVGPQHYKTVEGLGQAAFMFNPADNPTKAVTITFLQNDDTVTLQTFGIGASAAETLAKTIAASMKPAR